MIKLLSICILAAFMTAMEAPGESALPGATPLANVDKKMPMLELLPVGSVLSRVSFPRYEQQRLSLLLTADRMKVTAPREITGYALNIRLYGKRGETTHLFSKEAAYFLDKKLIVSHVRTTLREKTFSAAGSGLYLDSTTRRGILLGPAQTTIQIHRPNNKQTP